MKLNLSLRLKVTFINTMVLIICSVILTITTSFSVSRSIDKIGMTSSAVSKPIIQQTVPKKVYNNNTIENNKITQAQTITQAAQMEKDKLAATSIISMLAVIVLGCIITYLTTGKSLESVKKLNDEIKDISEHNLSKKINEEGAEDEIKELTKSFNNMLVRIDDAFETQKQFSLNVAHELRTPLSVIQMKIDVFKKRKEQTTEDYKKLIGVIEKNNNRLSKVVEELLSICNRDNIERKDQINFDKIIKSIIVELREVASEKNINIDIDENMNVNAAKAFYGNEQLLYRAIYNLIENSIKYNIENGYVNIYLNEENDFISIVITNSGIGIEKEDYENIFKPFYRVDKSRSRKIGGSGLGLSIVKTIIDHHNGNIRVESDNSGSKFTIKIRYN
ncbi:ATP-binding protein [Clostridium sp. CCUG 7971]|uniref:sensor histidine kinase n=1 Tax=Clostridium sp. CCUG 7971 TaxID=2811414 RepID=UPI001ABB8BEF|nr:ATP-binding protein [Clostridium sp. CCUG 7971]MBO3444292.1 ATP-binding protein [Clostridium sp. CCUG 7971]